MSDPFEKVFGDYIPGTKGASAAEHQPAPTTDAQMAEEEGEAWADPIYRRRYSLKAGEEPVEFWTLGALAAALNRQSVTLRLWERNGWLPKPNYRSPANGAIAGKRLYTREQIIGLRLLAEEEGLLYAQVSPGSTNFPNRALELFQRLAK